MAEPYYRDALVELWLGDCREILPTLSYGATLTDPPYGVGANRMTLGNGRERLYRGERDWDREPADLSALDLSRPAIVWGGNYFSLPPSGRWLVWDKGTGDNDFADCELAWTNLRGVVRMFKHGWVGSNARERVEGRRWHPTQKPVALMEWCLRFLPPDAIVVDPFAGSGSTLLAARNVGRRAIGVEIEERYCEMTTARLAQGSLALEA